MKIDPIYSLLYGTTPLLPVEEESIRKNLFRDETLGLSRESLGDDGDGNDNNQESDTHYKGGAIVKCLDEMKRLNDNCQKR